MSAMSYIKKNPMLAVYGVGAGLFAFMLWRPDLFGKLLGKVAVGSASGIVEAGVEVVKSAAVATGELISEVTPDAVKEVVKEAYTVENINDWAENSDGANIIQAVTEPVNATTAADIAKAHDEYLDELYEIAQLME